MWIPQLSSRLDRFQKVGAHVVAAIEAVPELHEMAAPLHAALERLEVAGKSREEARSAIMAKCRLREKAGTDLDRAVRQLYLDLLSAVGGNKNCAPFQVAFPEGVAPLLDPVSSRRMPQLLGLEVRLKSLEGMTPRAEVLATARVAFEASLVAVMSAQGAGGTARAELESAKIGFARELRVIYGRLTAHLGDARKVDAFFPPCPKKVQRAKAPSSIPIPPWVPVAETE